MSIYQNLMYYFQTNPIKNGLDLIEVDYYTITDLQDLDKKLGKGIYSWYLLPPPFGDNSSLKSYHTLFWDKEFKTDVRSKLGEHYSGSIDYKLSESLNSRLSNFDFTDPDHQKIFRMSSLLFSNPIYIGRSVNLEDRLRAHIKELRKYIDDPASFEEAFNNDTFELDSDFESSSFAKRISSYLYNTLGRESFKNKVSLNYFVVKVMSIKSESIKDEDLIDLEYYLNRTFRPIIGNL